MVAFVSGVELVLTTRATKVHSFVGMINPEVKPLAGKFCPHW